MYFCSCLLHNVNKWFVRVVAWYAYYDIQQFWWKYFSKKVRFCCKLLVCCSYIYKKHVFLSLIPFKYKNDEYLSATNARRLRYITNIDADPVGLKVVISTTLLVSLNISPGCNFAFTNFNFSWGGNPIFPTMDTQPHILSWPLQMPILHQNIWLGSGGQEEYFREHL